MDSSEIATEVQERGKLAVIADPSIGPYITKDEMQKKLLKEASTLAGSTDLYMTNYDAAGTSGSLVMILCGFVMITLAYMTYMYNRKMSEEGSVLESISVPLLSVLVIGFFSFVIFAFMWHEYKNLKRIIYFLIFGALVSLFFWSVFSESQGTLPSWSPGSISSSTSIYTVFFIFTVVGTTASYATANLRADRFGISSIPTLFLLLSTYGFSLMLMMLQSDVLTTLKRNDESDDSFLRGLYFFGINFMVLIAVVGCFLFVDKVVNLVTGVPSRTVSPVLENGTPIILDRTKIAIQTLVVGSILSTTMMSWYSSSSMEVPESYEPKYESYIYIFLALIPISVISIVLFSELRAVSPNFFDIATLVGMVLLLSFLTFCGIPWNDYTGIALFFLVSSAVISRIANSGTSSSVVSDVISVAVTFFSIKVIYGLFLSSIGEENLTPGKRLAVFLIPLTILSFILGLRNKLKGSSIRPAILIAAFGVLYGFIFVYQEKGNQRPSYLEKNEKIANSAIDLSVISILVTIGGSLLVLSNLFTQTVLGDVFQVPFTLKLIELCINGLVVVGLAYLYIYLQEDYDFIKLFRETQEKLNRVFSMFVKDVERVANTASSGD